MLGLAIELKNHADETKFANACHKLMEEDPCFVVERIAATKQTVIRGLGELHLRVVLERLKEMGIELLTSKPKVAYKETITGKADGHYRHKKQTGGAGQFAELAILVEPMDGDFQPPDAMKVRNEHTAETEWGSKIHYVDAIVGGVIDMQRFFGAIQKGVAEMLREGPVAGYPVGDVRVVVYDGSMHSVDSNENAFKTAARMCFRDAFRQASPVILEPIYDIAVIVPDTHTGDVIGDLNTRRARIQGIESEGVFQKILAQAPESDLYRYSTSLRSITSGRGIHSATFSHYEAMPRHVQDQLVAEAEALEEA
jgi:elongation factor G